MSNLKIAQGAQDYQVYQRDHKDQAQIRIEGSFQGNAVVEACVKQGHEIICDWHEVGMGEDGHWSAVVSKVPTGGPYDLFFRAKFSPRNLTCVRSILVGDIWVLAGQSNMEGLGLLSEAVSPHPLVHSYNMTEYWEVAREPLHRLMDSIDIVHSHTESQRRGAKLLAAFAKPNNRHFRNFIHSSMHAWRQYRSPNGTGLGLPFAKEMVKNLNVPIGLVPCAHGATSISKWDPALEHLEGGSLYGSMMRRFRVTGGKAKGILWYQGESDGFPTDAPLYYDRFKSFISRVREDFGVENMPFFFVQIGRYTRELSPEMQLAWNIVQEAQRKIAEDVPNTAMVVSVDTGLCDAIHIDTMGLKTIGERLAKVALREVYGYKSLELGPRLEQVSLDPTNSKLIKVSFTHVNGSLKTNGEICGFSIRNHSNEEYAIIDKITIDSTKSASLSITLKETLPTGAVLWYGFSTNPVCKLHDEENMAVPVFGPIEIRS